MEDEDLGCYASRLGTVFFPLSSDPRSFDGFSGDDGTTVSPKLFYSSLLNIASSSPLLCQSLAGKSPSELSLGDL